MVCDFLPLLLVVGCVLVRTNVAKTNSATILDCTLEGSDGLYARGCSSKFMRCLKGVEYRYTCPRKLKFNVDSSKCENSRQVVACLNSNVAESDIVIKASQPFDCSRKKDGVYGTGKCSSTYYHCSRGHAAEMICPAGLYFNDKLNGCDEMDSIDECDVLNALRGFNQRREGHLGDEGEYIERNVEGSREFGGVGGKRRLSLGRGSSGKKRHNRNIHAKHVVHRAALDFSHINCSIQPDGSYALGKCSAHYIICFGRDTKLIRCRCHEGKVFDSLAVQCRSIDSVRGCKAAGKLSLIDLIQTHNSSSRIHEKIIPAPEIDEFCNAKGDGLYPAGCSNYFYYCGSRKGFRLTCPTGLFYESGTRTCESRSRVRECSLIDAMKRNNAATQNVAKYPKAMLDYRLLEQEINNQSVVKPATDAYSDFKSDSSNMSKTVMFESDWQKTDANELSCLNRPDGAFAIGCSNKFLMCSKGRAYIFSCPDGSIFDDFSKKCNFAISTIDCLRSLNNEQSSELDQNMGNIFHGWKNEQRAEWKFPNALASALTSKIDCTRRVDGLYFAKCQPEYTVCSGGNGYTFQCPDGMVMDSARKLCTLRENVAKCK